LNIDRQEYGFRAYMTQTRNSVRLLKYLGIGLIALPEPFTTPFGVALLFTAYHLSQKLEAGPDNFFLETPDDWLKRSGDHAAGGPGVPVEVRLYTRSANQPLPWQHEGSRSLEANSPLGWKNWYDTKVNIVYHTIDLPTLYRRYKVRNNSPRVKPGGSRLTGLAQIASP
jgi:hypothetical protein